MDTIDLVALRTTIATDQNIVTLRFSVTTLLGLVEERIQKLAGLNPLATPAFVTERVEVIRSQLGQIGVEVMRSIGRDVLDGIDRLDAQILAASKR